jgi:hypothetical protein
VGAVLAASHRDELVDAHDEDWFRNPRAIDRLRHENAAPAGEPPTEEEAGRALSLLVARLEAAVG